MKDQIINNLDNPLQLEKMYRANKASFKREFNILYAKLKGGALADFWNERLNYEDEINQGTRSDLIFVIVASLIAALVAKLPAIFNIDEDFFYPRNIGFIIFPVLSAFFIRKNKLSTGKLTFVAGAMLFSVIFINLLPNVEKSDTLILSSIHLLVYLWLLLGFVFSDGLKEHQEKRLGFLKYNGDLVVIAALIIMAGGIMTGITIGLFHLIGLKIEKFYFEYVVVFGLSAAPVLGTCLIQTNPQLVGKVSPMIARIFSPLVLVMLVVYLIAIVYSGKDPYNDREFLMIFNVLLIGVMAIIFFSIAEVSRTKSRIETWVLLLLSVLTVIVNGIALSAILFRISEWGVTPNRTAVLGGNVLILIHLLLVTVQLLRLLSGRGKAAEVGKAITFYLPVYFLWSIVVTFLFPLIFAFK